MSNQLYDEGIETDVNRAILSNDGAIHAVLAYSDDPDFMKDEDQHLVWKAAVELSKNDQPVDPALVRTKVTQEGWASERRIEQILYDLTLVQESDENIDAWALQLYNLYSKRKALKKYGEAQSKIRGGDEFDDVNKWLSDELSDLSMARRRQPLDEILDEYVEEIEFHRKHGIFRSGLKLGIPKFDALTNGVGDSYLTIIAAVPKAGKTTLAWQTVDNVLENSDRRVVVVSLEMRETELFERWLSMRSMVAADKISKADLTDEEFEAIEEARDEIRAWIQGDRFKVITQEDIPGTVTAEKIRNVLIAEHSRDPVGYAVLDYFQLLNFSDTAEAEKAVHTINSIPKSLGIPTTLISQFNRGPRSENRPPKPSDLHATSALENDLDVLILMDRKDKRVHRSRWAAHGVIEGQVDCELALNRHGDIGEWSMQMDEEVPIFLIHPGSEGPGSPVPGSNGPSSTSGSSSGSSGSSSPSGSSGSSSGFTIESLL